MGRPPRLPPRASRRVQTRAEPGESVEGSVLRVEARVRVHRAGTGDPGCPCGHGPVGPGEAALKLGWTTGGRYSPMTKAGVWALLLLPRGGGE